MIARILQEKFGRRFETLDINNAGMLELADYEAYVDRIAAAAGRHRDSPLMVRLRVMYVALWTDIARRAGSARLSRAQYVQALHDSIVTSDAGADEMFYPLVSVLIEIFDSNADGQLGNAEFARWMVAYGVTPEQAAEAFRQLDVNGDGVLGCDELVAAFHEFYRSDDPDARGNWLLGPLPSHSHAT